VFEVNSSPSIREAEAVCGCDIAARIVDRALSLAEARPPAPRRRGRAPAVPAARPQ
jgi:hypothetical protein